jgi:Holliday junction DNA helicase RuvA
VIDRIRGRLVDRTGHGAVVDVGGFGLEVEMSQRALACLPAVGEEVELRTRLWVREDTLRLVGFGDEEEREAYDQLCQVSGVGPRLSLQVLGALPPQALREAVALGDVEALTRVPGVGKKLAQRIAVDLKEWARKPREASANPDGPSWPLAPLPSGNQEWEDAVRALTVLGYGGAQAQKAVAEAYGQGVRDTQSLVRLALLRLGRAPVTVRGPGEEG